MSNFSLDRPGALQQRGGDSDGLPGTAASVAGTVRARCLVSTGTRETTPGSSNCSSVMYPEIHLFQRHIILLTVQRDVSGDTSVPETYYSFNCSSVVYLEIHLFQRHITLLTVPV